MQPPNTVLDPTATLRALYCRHALIDHAILALEELQRIRKRRSKGYTILRERKGHLNASQISKCF